MPRKAMRRRVDAKEAVRYSEVAEQFFAAAELAREFEYWNAAALLLVHGAIALADAVSIGLKSVRASSENHKDAVALLGEVVGEATGKKEALTHLERIIDEKNRVAYSGIAFRSSDVERMRTHVERFRAFAGPLLSS